jgi:hypothetical protein
LATCLRKTKAKGKAEMIKDFVVSVFREGYREFLASAKPVNDRFFKLKFIPRTKNYSNAILLGSVLLDCFWAVFVALKVSGVI